MKTIGKGTGKLPDTTLTMEKEEMKRKQITEITSCFDCKLLKRKFNKNSTIYKCSKLKTSTKTEDNWYIDNELEEPEELGSWFKECPEWESVTNSAKKDLYNIALDDAEKACNEAISITAHTWPEIGSPDVIDYQEAIECVIKGLKQ